MTLPSSSEGENSFENKDHTDITTYNQGDAKRSTTEIESPLELSIRQHKHMKLASMGG